MGTLPHSTLRPRLVSTLPPALSDSRSPGRPPPLPPFPLPPPLSPRSAPRPPPALPPPLPGTAAAAARSSSRRPRSSGLRSSAAASTMASTVSGRRPGRGLLGAAAGLGRGHRPASPNSGAGRGPLSHLGTGALQRRGSERAEPAGAGVQGCRGGATWCLERGDRGAVWRAWAAG